MYNTSLKLTEISKELTLLPDEKLEEVKDFIDFILSRTNVKKKNVIKLEGIWANKGFEKLAIEKELKSVRKELASSILKRKL